MKHFGVNMQGTFLGERLASLPTWTSADEGRLVYSEAAEKYYVGTSVEWVEVGSGSGSALPLVLPNDCSLDDTYTDIARGSAFGMIETLDYAGSTNGAAWFTFHFPSTLDSTKDINLLMVYNLDGSDDSKIVTIQTAYWVYGDTTTPSEGSPTATNSDNISTGVSQNGQRQSTTLTAISNAYLTSGHTITLRILRASSDTYSGTFQMMYLYMYQS